MDKQFAISPSFASFLDLARALSAIAVFLNHLRDPLFLGYPQLPPAERTPIVRAWFFLTGFGFSAVMVFFVLSGFLVGGVGLSRVRNQSFRSSSYFIDRFSRLFVVLIPALLVTVVLDYLGQRYFGSIGFWDRTNPVIASKFAASFLSFGSWKSLACNAAMLQSFYCQIYGSDVPLWSLSYEFWFYICFGLFAVALLRKIRGLTLVPLAIIVMALGSDFVWLAVVWIFGILAYAYSGERFRWPRVSIPLFIILAAAVRVVDPGQPHGNVADDLLILAEGAAFAWVLISVRGIQSELLVKIRPVCARLAGFSYSLYLIHFPLMLFVIAVLARALKLGNMPNGVTPLSALGIGLYLGVFLIVMAMAWGLASMTESHTQQVRAWLRSLLSSSTVKLSS